MDIEKIEKFIDAGYTKAEIEALEHPDTKGGDNSGKAKEPDNASAEKEQGSANLENESALEKVGTSMEIAAAIEALTNTVSGLKETVKAMQDANAGKAATDKPKKDTIGEAMQSFINTL